MTNQNINNEWEDFIKMNVSQKDDYLQKNNFTINVPNYVVNIDDKLFSHCLNLREIILHNSIKSIGDESFSFCKNLKSIIIPSSLKKIYTNSFLECNNLELIIFKNRLDNINFKNDRKMKFLDKIKHFSFSKKIEYFINVIKNNKIIILSEISGSFTSSKYLSYNYYNSNGLENTQVIMSNNICDSGEQIYSYQSEDNSTIDNKFTDSNLGSDETILSNDDTNSSNID